jgi:hypothetical protein
LRAAGSTLGARLGLLRATRDDCSVEREFLTRVLVFLRIRLPV